MIDLTQFEAVTGESRYAANPLTTALGPWSVSRAKTAGRCAKQYEWQYLDKRQGDADIEHRDDAMRIGSAMHSVYEELLLGETDRIAARNKAYVDQKITTTERETMEELFVGIDWFMGCVHGFIQTRVCPGNNYILGELSRDGFVGVEKRFAPTSDLSFTKDYFNNKGGTFLRGIIDLVLFTQDNGAIVIDHKSARFSGNMYLYTEQLRAYAIAVLAMYPHLEWVQCGIHFMALQEVKFNDPLRRSDAEGERRALYHFITEAANNVLTGEIQVGSFCKWCAYKTSCLALRKQLRQEKSAAKRALKEAEKAAAREKREAIRAAKRAEKEAAKRAKKEKNSETSTTAH